MDRGHLAPVVVLLAAMGCSKKEPPDTIEQPAQTPNAAALEAGAFAPPPRAKEQEVPPPMDVAGPPEDAQKTESGLAHRVIKPGTGKKHPGPVDAVVVHYAAWKTDGTLFDSTPPRAPRQFQVNAIIKGWAEGLQLMVVGEKRRLWIPAELAFGHSPDRGPSGMVVYDVELLDIIEAPKAPPDVAGPPKNAKRTSSGLAYRVLKKGTGKVHPDDFSTVRLHYTGWTTDGRMFDSSRTRIEPADVTVGSVIPGWVEGLKLMVVGEKTRFWIPGELGYDKSSIPDMPKGMLVYDIELLAILAK